MITREEHETHELLGIAYALLGIVAGSREKGIPAPTWTAIDEWLKRADARRARWFEEAE